MTITPSTVVYDADVEPMSDQEVLSVRVSDLLLDAWNPRLPISDQGEDKSQEDLALLLGKRYNPLAVAHSISRHGYFKSEPMVAVRDGSKFRVLEGNRRLTALKGLTDSSLRELLAKENRGWSLLNTERAPDTVPVLVVQDERDVDALLGFRHISGIEPWSPYQQAQFIAKLVDERHMSLEKVAEIVGKPETAVRSRYRDLDIIRLAERLGIDAQGARSNFGVFTAAMGRPALRGHIGASAPRHVDPEFEPFPEKSRENVDELFSMLFGENRVITDSRELKLLSQIMSDENALGVLRETRNLYVAEQALGSSENRGRQLIVEARGVLEEAQRYIGSEDSEELLVLLDQLEEILTSLRANLGE